ncbi:MAG TPA: R3H domain-containing nucleic acid-binding protein [Thermoanaerobaculia bacterium]|nr:R3H domain-containing nucleic acid-binding protein [Thermoanaerobaculia bacterium]
MSDNEIKRKFFSGRSVDQAVVAAASHYGVTPGELKFRELEKRHGFVRTRRNVVISVDPEDFRKAPEAAPARRPSPAAAPPRAEAPALGAREEAATEEPPEPRRPPARRKRAPSRPPRDSAESNLESQAESHEEGEAEIPEEGRAERAAPAPRRPRRERPARQPVDRPVDRPQGGEPARTPWWQAPPVADASVDEDEDHEAVAEEADFEALVEEPGDEQPADLPDPPQPRRPAPEGRYRFVERSEGLRRRGTPLPGVPTEREPSAGPGGQRGSERPRGRGGRGRGSRQERGRGGRGGGRDRREAEPPRQPLAPPPPRPAPRSERLARAEAELAQAAQAALDLLLGFADIEAEADFYRNEDRLEVELWGPDDHLLLQNEGQILLAIEHLLPRMLRGLYGDSMAVRVDCNDFHVEREERLRELALRTADDVRQQGRPRTLEELDPAERRIVHLTLADDPDVTTDSIGDGYWKRLKVIPRSDEE